MPLRGTVCAVRAPVRRWILLVLTLALVTASCGGGDGGDTQQVESSFTPPRTYEDLDLSGPEAAVAEFISAFIRRDYIAAALILHPDAQRTMSAAVAENDLTGLVAQNAEPAVVARMAIERDGDHLLGGVRVFEVAMEEAMTNGGFIVDLASGAEGSPCERRISSARSSKASSPPTAATSSSNSPRPPTSVGESAQPDSPTAHPFRSPSVEHRRSTRPHETSNPATSGAARSPMIHRRNCSTRS